MNSARKRGELIGRIS